MAQAGGTDARAGCRRSTSPRRCRPRARRSVTARARPAMGSRARTHCPRVAAFDQALRAQPGGERSWRTAIGTSARSSATTPNPPACSTSPNDLTARSITRASTYYVLARPGPRRNFFFCGKKKEGGGVQFGCGTHRLRCETVGARAKAPSRAPTAVATSRRPSSPPT